MGQRDHHRPLAETLADALLERSGSEEARDRHLADEDQDLWLEQAKLSVEPVGAVGHRGGRRPQVSGFLFVAAWKAAHERGDVSEPAKLFCVAKAGAQHPAVELLAGAPGKRPPRRLLRGPGSLADDEEGSSPPAFEGGIRLGNDPVVHAYVTCAARGLVGEELLR